MSADERIHHSISDADDMEEVWDDRIYVKDVLWNLVHHPAQIITRWNWKTAVMGAIVRGSFYFTVYQVSRQGWLVTLTAVAVEFAFRFLTTGVAGALVQSFRKARPVWLSYFIVSILLPAFSHTIEFVTHFAQERYFADVFAASDNGIARQRAFAISVLFSVVSVLFNLYAMRSGVLLVGAHEETKPFLTDMKRIPRLIGQFVSLLPSMIAGNLEKGRLLNALAAFAAFGLTVGTILGTFRGSWAWTYRTALGAWAFLLAAILIALVGRSVRRRYGKVY
jgi:hypothetical protein